MSSIEIEEKLLKSHIKTFPYPSYQQMIRQMKNHPLYYDLYAEYGQMNHNALKKIYESEMDPEVAKKLGNLIYARGGTHALQMNCTVFMSVGPFTTSGYDHVRYNGGKSLELAWDGIGEFRC